MEHYSGTPILVAADNVILGFDAQEEVLKVLLIRRRVEPDAGKWSLVGSFIDPSESAHSAAKRILRQYTGIEIAYLEQFRTYSSVHRDSGDRVISIAYYSLIRIDDLTGPISPEFSAQWVTVNEAKNLVMDHDKILRDALNAIKEKSKLYPLGVNLLPEKFTLPTLLKLYQEIYKEPLDDRNFRRKILSSGILLKLDEKDKSNSRKGAFYYQFNIQNYYELVKKGFSFQFV